MKTIWSFLIEKEKSFDKSQYSFGIKKNFSKKGIEQDRTFLI